MNLNGVIAVSLRHFTEFGSFGVNYVTMVEGEPIRLRQTCSPAQRIYFSAMYDL